jgi:SulP family sulfate permease
MKNLKFTKGDFFGGLTSGIVALPLAMGFGLYSGLGAAAGLYGAIFLGFFAALFGGTSSQVSGPTGPMTVVTAVTVATFLSKTGGDFNSSACIGAIVASFILAGLLQVAMGLLKIGSLIKYIPYPVVSGFMSGIGIIIILLQLFVSIGLNSPGSTLDVVKRIGPALQYINYWALLYALLTIAIIYIIPRFTKAVPGTLVALLAVTLLSVLLDKNVPLIGEIPRGFPEIKLKEVFSIDASLYKNIVEAAVTLAALGAIDSLLTSVIADNKTKTRHNSNQELIGQGIGNTICGMFMGLPGAGATMRTMVNIRSGGRHKTSGAFHSIILLLVLMGAGQYATLIPRSVLAGILITVGIGILDYKSLGHLKKIPVPDAIIMLIVLFVTVFFDLLLAVGIGLVLASVLFMKKMGDLAEEKSGVMGLSAIKTDIAWPDEQIPQYMKDNVLVKHLEGPLFFGFVSGFQNIAQTVTNIKFVVIRMEKVPFVDQSGLYALEEVILGLEQKNIEVMLTGLQTQPEDMMRRIRIIPDLVSENNIYKDFNKCIAWLAKNQHDKLIS